MVHIPLSDRFRPNVGDLAASRDIPALMRLLGHRDPKVRDGAAAALHDLAAADPDPFVRLLVKGSPEDRARAADVLAGIEGLEAGRLIAHLDDADAAPAVVDLLARTGPRSVPDLVNALGARNGGVRDGAVLALARMGTAAWPALVPRLRDPSRRRRLEAARALEAGGWTPAGEREAYAFRSAIDDWDAVAAMGPTAVPFLVEAIADPHPAVRSRAALTLGRCGDAAAAEPLLDLLARDPAAEVREAAAQSLGLLAAQMAVPGLRAALDDPSASVRAASAAALGSLGWSPRDPVETAAFLAATGQWSRLGGLGPTGIGRLVSALGDDFYGVRRGAAGALLALGVVARPALERARAGENTVVRDEAAALLARMGPGPAGIVEEPAPVEPGPAAAAVPVPAPPPPPLPPIEHAGAPFAYLVGQLFAADPPARSAAASALADLPPDRALPALGGALLDADPAVRRAAVVALDRLGTPDARRLLLDRLADPDPGVRATAERAVSRAGEEAVEMLARLLQHPDPELRLRAVSSLGAIGGERAGTLLRQACADPSPVVRNSAARLLYPGRPESSEG